MNDCIFAPIILARSNWFYVGCWFLNGCDFAPIVSARLHMILCFCSHYFKVQLIMCIYSYCFRSNWMCLCLHCFSVGPIDCPSSNWMYMICADLSLWCNCLFDFCNVDAKLLSYKIFWYDYVKWNSICNINFRLSLNACLCEGFCLLVCMLNKVWECTLRLPLKLNVIFAQARVQKTSQFLWHQTSWDPNWWITYVVIFELD